MTASTRTATGEPKVLARYSCNVGERIVVAQRVEGTVQLRDEPASGEGRRFLIEPHVASMAEIEAIVEDYLRMAKRLGYVPMHGWY